MSDITDAPSQGTILTVKIPKELEDLPNFDHFTKMVELQTKLVACDKSVAQNEDLGFARWERFLPPRTNSNYKTLKTALQSFCDCLVDSVTRQIVVKNVRFVKELGEEEEEEEEEDCCAEAVLTHHLEGLASKSTKHPGLLAKMNKKNPQLFEFLNELDEDEGGEN